MVFYDPLDHPIISYVQEEKEQKMNKYYCACVRALLDKMNLINL